MAVLRYFDGCDGVGRDCTPQDCLEAFHTPGQLGVGIIAVCLVDNVSCSFAPVAYAIVVTRNVFDLGESQDNILRVKVASAISPSPSGQKMPGQDF